jgi:hypothetical protein
MVERYLPAAHRGCVIITARVANWTKAFKAHHIEPMVEREAVAFLNLRLRTNTTQDIYASEIAAALGGLPLALEHAAAYVEQTRQPLRTYLRLIESDRRELLSRSNPGMTNYRLSVAATFRLTIVRLGILPRYILQIAACFAPEPIPRRCFEYLLSSQELLSAMGIFELYMLRRSLDRPQAIENALVELNSYSLISLSSESLRMHSFLQTVVREFMPLSALKFLSLYISFSIAKNVPRIRKKAERALWPIRAVMLLAKDGLLPTTYYEDTHKLFPLREFIPHCQAALNNLPSDSLQNNTNRYRIENVIREYRRKADTLVACMILLPFSFHTKTIHVNIALNLNGLLSILAYCVNVPSRAVTRKKRLLYT